MSDLIMDLSKYNVVNDWSAVKHQVAAVILRVGYRGYGSGKIVLDPKFEEFAKNCKAQYIPMGLYFMSQAITKAEAVEEAQFACKYAKLYNIKYPIFIDVEDGDGTAKVVRADGLSKTARTDIAVAFCEEVKKQGFVGGVYSSTSWYISKLDVNRLLPYKIWCAQYAPKCTATHRVDAWQYTSDGNIAGIPGRVDLSFDYGFLKETNVKKENPYPAPKRILKRTNPMMTGDDVKWLQFELGMAEKDIDGKFGDGTNKVYKAYLGF